MGRGENQRRPVTHTNPAHLPTPISPRNHRGCTPPRGKWKPSLTGGTRMAQTPTPMRRARRTSETARTTPTLTRPPTPTGMRMTLGSVLPRRKWRLFPIGGARATSTAGEGVDREGVRPPAQQRTARPQPPSGGARAHLAKWTRSSLTWPRRMTATPPVAPRRLLPIRNLPGDHRHPKLPPAILRWPPPPHPLRGVGLGGSLASRDVFLNTARACHVAHPDERCRLASMYRPPPAGEVVPLWGSAPPTDGIGA